MKRRMFSLLVFISIVSVNSADAGVIITVGGNDTQGYSGDGLAAIDANLSYPLGISLDTNNNIYIADSYNHRIRKIDGSGVITTIAGSGTMGYSGDSGTAISANLNYPADVITDSSGNVFIADTSNHRIRKIDTFGNVTTIAGSGAMDYSGDNGQAVDAALNYPQGIAIDSSGNLYIADTGNNRIRKVDALGVITTIAGDGNAAFTGDSGPAIWASLNNPSDIITDSSGNILIADSLNNRIRKIDINGIITTIAGNGSIEFSGDGGQAINAGIDTPVSIAADTSGNILFTDSNNQRIRTVDTSGVITTVAGNTEMGFSSDGLEALETSLWMPTSLLFDANGNILFSDTANHRIRRVSLP